MGIGLFVTRATQTLTCGQSAMVTVGNRSAFQCESAQDRGGKKGGGESKKQPATGNLHMNCFKGVRRLVF